MTSEEVWGAAETWSHFIYFLLLPAPFKVVPVPGPGGTRTLKTRTQMMPLPQEVAKIKVLLLWRKSQTGGNKGPFLGRSARCGTSGRVWAPLLRLCSDSPTFTNVYELGRPSTPASINECSWFLCWFLVPFFLWRWRAESLLPWETGERLQASQAEVHSLHCR